jgi:hypothetical protein
VFAFLDDFDDLDLKESSRDELFDEDACEAALDTGRFKNCSGLVKGAEVGAMGKGLPAEDPGFLDGNRE